MAHHSVFIVSPFFSLLCLSLSHAYNILYVIAFIYVKVRYAIACSDIRPCLLFDLVPGPKTKPLVKLG